MEVCFEVGIILGDKHLVVDVAEVEKRLIAALTIDLGFIVDLLTHSAFPLDGNFLLVFDPAVSLIV